MTNNLWRVLLRAVLETDAEEVNCIDCCERLDQYAELLLQGADPEEIMPAVKLHLEHCPCCAQEFEALMIMLQDNT